MLRIVFIFLAVGSFPYWLGAVNLVRFGGRRPRSAPARVSELVLNRLVGACRLGCRIHERSLDLSPLWEIVSGFPPPIPGKAMRRPRSRTSGRIWQHRNQHARIHLFIQKEWGEKQVALWW